jgi:hypothetical protein
MRHLRSVNEILIGVGEAPSLSRAAIIGEDFDGNGKAFNRPFELVPLSRAQLDFFIDVERASQSHTGDQDTIDGMYTVLLRSVAASSEFTEGDKQRLAQLVKVIIDEGMDHFRRFERVEAALSGLAEAEYLRVVGPPTRLPDADADRILQDTVDAAYQVLLRSLDYVFRLGDLQRGAMMEAARRAMYNMDDAARSLATRGIAALFELDPSMVSGPAPAGMADPAQVALSVGDPLRAIFPKLRTAHGDLAERMQTRLNEMTRAFEAAAESVRR